MYLKGHKIQTKMLKGLNQFIQVYLCSFNGENSGFLADVKPVEELPDVLVLDSGALLDQRGGLGHGIDGVAHDDQLVLLGLAVLNGDTGGHAHLPDELLAQEVPDLDEGAALSDGAIDGEMSVHGPHLVQESLEQHLL